MKMQRDQNTTLHMRSHVRHITPRGHVCCVTGQYRPDPLAVLQGRHGLHSFVSEKRRESCCPCAVACLSDTNAPNPPVTIGLFTLFVYRLLYDVLMCAVGNQ